MKVPKMIRVFLFLRVSAAMVLSLTIETAYAQVAPDAGELLREQGLQLPQPTTNSPDLVFPVPVGVVRVQPGGPQVKVRAVKFEGNTAFDHTELAACLGSEVLEHSYDLAGLQHLAERVTNCYRKKGYPFARAFVPGQDMRDGQLLLQVIEGRYGEVRLEGDARAAEAGSFAKTIKPGELIKSDVLERAMLLLSDQPGWQLEPVMQPGQAVGTGDLVLKLTPTAPVELKMGIDNQGNRFTGAERARADMQFNSAFKLGDRIVINAIASNSDLFFGNLAYSVPVGGEGLRAQLSIARTQYRIGEEFANLGAHGMADVVGAGLIYPLLRTRSVNVNLAGQLHNKSMRDVQDSSATNSIKHSTVLPISLSFDRQDELLGAGLIYGNVTLTLGRLSLGDREARRDGITARTNGTFDKWNIDLVRLQGLESLIGRPKGAQVDLYARLSSQLTNGNLDSSEKLGIGGATGVRAYPTGEGTGDRGWLAQFEVRARWQDWTPYMFIDAGSVQLNARTWDSIGNNTRNLAGAGVGLRAVHGSLSGDLSVAWRHTGGGSQSDPAHRQPSLWLSLAYRYK